MKHLPIEALLDNQLNAIDRLNTLKVGALFMEPGTGKTRAAMELINSVTEPVATLWLGPFQTIFPEQKGTGIIDEINKWGGVKHSIRFCGIETLSSSSRTYLDLTQWCSNNNVFIVVDESLKIKNWDAKRTQRIIELGKLCQYKLILNGTPISRNLLDVWAQMEFLSPKILNMRQAEYKNSFCEYTTVKKRFGNKWFQKEFITKYHNIDYLYSLIKHYVYEADLDLTITQQYHDIGYKVDDETKEQYRLLKEKYLDNEKLLMMNNNIFLELTQKMQHLYSCSAEKITVVKKLLETLDPTKTIIYTKYISSHEECKKNFPLCKVLSYQKNSLGLNLQQYNATIFFDKIWDYALRMHATRRTFRTGQQSDCLYYDLTGDVNLEELINQNINKKMGMVEYFKSKSIEEIKKAL